MGAERLREMLTGDGFVRALLVEPGTIVTAGEPLVESEEPTLKAELDVLRARVVELEARLATERIADRVRAEITATELGQARAELATTAGRAERLIARSESAGTFAVAKPQDLPGRFLREGQSIGYVLPPGSRIVRARSNLPTTSRSWSPSRGTTGSRTATRLLDAFRPSHPHPMARRSPPSPGGPAA